MWLKLSCWTLGEQEGIEKNKRLKTQKVIYMVLLQGSNTVIRWGSPITTLYQPSVSTRPLISCETSFSPYWRWACLWVSWVLVLLLVPFPVWCNCIMLLPVYWIKVLKWEKLWSVIINTLRTQPLFNYMYTIIHAIPSLQWSWVFWLIWEGSEMFSVQLHFNSIGVLVNLTF